MNAAESVWSRFFTDLTSFLAACERQYGIANERYTEYVIDHLSLSCQSVLTLRERVASAQVPSLNDVGETLTELLEELRRVLQLWRDYSDTLTLRFNSTRYELPIEERPSHSRGRSRFNISRGQLQYLRSLSFSWSAIADILMVSRMTLYRRRVEFGMLDEPSSIIGEEELLSVVRQISREHPQVGQSFILGRLRSLGYRVTRERVRKVVRLCDPLSTALRWHGNPAYRRPYSVPGPNSLWHIGKMFITEYRICAPLHFTHTCNVIVIFFLCRWASQAHTVATRHPWWNRRLQSNDSIPLLFHKQPCKHCSTPVSCCHSKIWTTFKGAI